MSRRRTPGRSCNAISPTSSTACSSSTWRRTSSAALRNRAEKSLIGRGYLATYTITSIAPNSGDNGYDVQQSYSLPKTNDYVTLDNTILIG